MSNGRELLTGNTTVEISVEKSHKPNGHLPDTQLRQSLQNLEGRLSRITRLTTILLEGLNRFDENDPDQSGEFISKVIKTGRLVEKLRDHYKPPLEDRAAALRQQLQEIAEASNRKFGQVRELGDKGLLPQTVVEKATASYFAYRASFDNGNSEAEQTHTSVNTITPLEAAITSIAIADAYTTQEDEQIFSLDREFYPFFGRLCASLPHGTDATTDAYGYRKIRQRAVQKVISEMTESGEYTEAGETGNLLEWIKSHIKNKEAFFQALLRAEDYGDENSHIDLREKFKDVLIESNRKFFSLHPQIREVVKAEVVEPANIEAEQFKTNTPSEEEPKPEKGILINRVRVKTTPKQTEKPEKLPLSDSELETLNWIAQAYRNQEGAITGDLIEAHSVAAKAGLILFYNKVDEVVALWNLTRYRDTGISMSPEEAEAMKAYARNALRKKAS